MDTNKSPDSSNIIWEKFGQKPLIIAGPCSAETEEQVLETGQRILNTGKVDIYRAGIWKPRTRPGSFEGVGEIGLQWLSKMKQQTGLPVTVEVAKATHVDLCLKAGIDMFWIGARTTVNPFAVQEIADALKGVNIPVFIKNPINPDLALWIGGVERIQKAGINKLAVIHRGFSKLSEKYYRNSPQWQIPLEFKRMLPEIPMICDPSHICGRRDILQDVSQKALNLGYDGLMIESHIDPDNAWSDAAQQITPEVLGQLIDELIIRNDFEDVPKIQNELEILRQEINSIDDELLNLLSNRMQIARDIGVYKRKNKMTILQQRRWNEILDRCKAKAKDAQISEEFVINFINAIHAESIDQQEEIFRQKK